MENDLMKKVNVGMCDDWKKSSENNVNIKIYHEEGQLRGTG